MKFIFCMQVSMKACYKLIAVLSFLMEVARHVQNTQYKKLVIFLQYIRKNVELMSS